MCTQSKGNLRKCQRVNLCKVAKAAIVVATFVDEVMLTITVKTYAVIFAMHILYVSAFYTFNAHFFFNVSSMGQQKAASRIIYTKMAFYFPFLFVTFSFLNVFLLFLFFHLSISLNGAFELSACSFFFLSASSPPHLCKLN